MGTRGSTSFTALTEKSEGRYANQLTAEILGSGFICKKRALPGAVIPVFAGMTPPPPSFERDLIPNDITTEVSPPLRWMEGCVNFDF